MPYTLWSYIYKAAFHKSHVKIISLPLIAYKAIIVANSYRALIRQLSLYLIPDYYLIFLILE